MTSTEKRPYAGQSWAPGLMQDGNVKPTSLLQLVAMDLDRDARQNGVDGRGLPIELWEHTDGAKGLYFGDTTSLTADGWTKLAEF